MIVWLKPVYFKRIFLLKASVQMACLKLKLSLKIKFLFEVFSIGDFLVEFSLEVTTEQFYKLDSIFNVKFAVTLV